MQIQVIPPVVVLDAHDGTHTIGASFIPAAGKRAHCQIRKRRVFPNVRVFIEARDEERKMQEVVGSRTIVRDQEFVLLVETCITRNGRAWVGDRGGRFGKGTRFKYIRKSFCLLSKKASRQ